jgi:hypothetical protein
MCDTESEGHQVSVGYSYYEMPVKYSLQCLTRKGVNV